MQKKSFDIIIDNIKKTKKKILPNDKLILFGSQARYNASNDSDWDMLILLDKKEITKDDFSTYAYPFVELGWKFGEYFSMKLYTVSEWMKRKSSPFFKNVEKEGIEL
jgi:predicted nucleotidyltransferase